MKDKIIRLAVIGGAIAAVVLFLVFTYRSISEEEKPLNDKLQKSWNKLEANFDARVAALPELLKSAKPYIDDAEILKDVKKASKKVSSLDFDTIEVAEYKKAQDGVTLALAELLNVSEEYPELMENEKFRENRDALLAINEQIEQSVDEYNNAVDEYNRYTLKLSVFLLKHPDGKSYYDDKSDRYKDMVKEKYEYLGIDLIDFEDFWELLIRFSFNLLILVIGIRWLYYTRAKRKDYLFTYILIGSVVFLLCFLLENVKLQLGFALGLFAIFGIIRYRTDAIPIKEMTYLFLVIGISVINALANKKVSYVELIFTNLVVLTVAFFLEHVFLLKHESTKTVLYEKIDLIKAGRREELLKDLEERTGLKINRIEVGRINFLRDTVRIKVYYYERDQEAIFHEDDYGKSDRDDNF